MISKKYLMRHFIFFFWNLQNFTFYHSNLSQFELATFEFSVATSLCQVQRWVKTNCWRVLYIRTYTGGKEKLSSFRKELKIPQLMISDLNERKEILWQQKGISTHFIVCPWHSCLLLSSNQNENLPKEIFSRALNGWAFSPAPSSFS